MNQPPSFMSGLTPSKMQVTTLIDGECQAREHLAVCLLNRPDGSSMVSPLLRSFSP